MANLSKKLPRTWLSGLPAVILLASTGGLTMAQPVIAQTATERASTTTTNAQVFGDSDQVVISADGRWVAFQSLASDLVTGDSNGVHDIFVKDRVTGAIQRVSVSSANVQADADSHEPSISADGRFVAFASEASNLVSGAPASSTGDVFLRDRQLGTTQLVTWSALGTGSNGDCGQPRVSDDGRYVAFEGVATNLVTATLTSGYQVFRRDLALGKTELVSRTPSGASAGGFSWAGGISSDGRYVAFVSSGTDLVALDTNFYPDCFLRDMQGGSTRRVSVGPAGIQGTGGGCSPRCSLSRDGRFIAFSSGAFNLAPGEFAGGYDIFLHDVQEAATHRITFATSGSSANGHSYDPDVSDDGRYVAFQSFSTNLDALDTDEQSDVFLRDRVLGTTVLVSRSAVGATNGDTYKPSISGDGALIAFYGSSSDLVPSDTNQRLDVFVRDTGMANHEALCAGTSAICPCGNAGLGGAGCENSVATGGALLRASGRSNVSADQVRLLASGMPNSTSALFIQGTAQFSGTTGARFGDGLRCSGGTIVRLFQVQVSGGSAAMGYGLTGAAGTPVHVRGQLPANGGTRYYQIWYRNAAAFCTADTFNLSNGVEVRWSP